ncbi:MAG: hypothetical protein ACLUIQ_03175 [Dialister invisus]
MNADANDMARPAAMQQEKAAGRTQNFMDAKDADFMLTDVNGKEHRLSDYREKGVYQVLGFLVFCMYGYAG